METPIRHETDKGRIETASGRKAYVPDVDIVETENDVVLLADLPGVRKETLGVTLDQGVLTISGKTRVELPERAELVHQEIEFGDFSRSFRLGPEVTSPRMEASFEDGVLKIVFPKSDWASTKKIEVR